MSETPDPDRPPFELPDPRDLPRRPRPERQPAPRQRAPQVVRLRAVEPAEADVERRPPSIAQQWAIATSTIAALWERVSPDQREVFLRSLLAGEPSGALLVEIRRLPAEIRQALERLVRPHVKRRKR
jgi:hypothetical protein